TYSYTASGLSGGALDRLAAVTYSTSPSTRQTYLYENQAFPLALTGIIDENGNHFATWTYDQTGRATKSAYVDSTAGEVESKTVAYNNTTGSRPVPNARAQKEVYTFTTLQGVPKVIRIDRLAPATTTAATRFFTYDGHGYMASQADWNGN